jgi:Cys-rich repeat protein
VECAVDDDCADGVCSANVCVECAVDDDCADGVCSANVCVECAVDSDCDDGFECKEGACEEKPEVFRLLGPFDAEQLPEDPPAFFQWEPGPYTLFKIQFSKSPFFEPKKTYFIAPRKKKQFIEQPFYTPSKREWRKIQRFFRRSGIVYWRVLAYDAVMLNYVTHSEYRSFGF